MKSHLRRWIVLVTAMTCACMGEVDPALSSSDLPLLEGRSITVEAQSSLFSNGPSLSVGNGPLVQHQIDFSTVNAAAVTFNSYFVDVCVAQIGNRFDDYSTTPAGANHECRDAIVNQQVHLCQAYQMLNLADAVAPTDIYQVQETQTSMRVRRPGDTVDDGSLGDRVMTIPVLTGHDAATAARLGVEFARLATGEGALLLEGAGCPDIDLSVGVPTGNSETATTGFVVASATHEAMLLLTDGAELAERLIVASATSRTADDTDQARARIGQWRGRTDSRLEAVSVWMGTLPDGLYEPTPDYIADGEGVGATPAPLTGVDQGYPVVLRTAHTESERIAEDLLRSSRVDPRDPQVADNVVSALIEANPAGFGTDGMSSSVFFRNAGTTIEDVQRVAITMSEEAIVRARPITPSSMTMGGVQLVDGTSPRVVPTDGAHYMARTIGARIGHHGDSHAPNFAFYLNGGVVGTLQFAHDMLVHSMDQPGLTPEAQEMMRNALAHTLEFANMRSRVCVGPETGSPPVQTSVDFTLYGVESEIASAAARVEYEVWAGANGLRCALYHTVEDQRCDEADYRVTTIPTVTTSTDVGESSLGSTALQWTITGPDVPGESDGIPATTIFYVTTRAQPRGEPAMPPSPDGLIRRRALVAFGIQEGAEATSRCTFLPVGRSTDHVEQLLAVHPEAPEYPENTCAGVPFDIGLPLEDEIGEAATSSPVAEQVFMHYLDRADQAAARAEQLGERLISEQLEMQQVAETAAERINEICGTNLSAGYVSESPQSGCIVDADCAPPATCQIESGAMDGVCVGGSLADLLHGDDADIARLRRCLGDADQVGAATLGQTQLCAWTTDDGRLCGCPSTTPNRCDDITCLGSAENCQPIFDQIQQVAEGPDGSGSVTTFATLPMAVVPAGGGAPRRPGDCRELAYLRAATSMPAYAEGDPPFPVSELASRVSQQAWIEQRSLGEVASAMSLEPDVAGFISMLLGGRVALTTGSIAAGPVTTQFPCAPSPNLSVPDREVLCDRGATGPNGDRSILCGQACSSITERTAIARRLENAACVLASAAGVPVHRGFLEHEFAPGGGGLLAAPSVTSQTFAPAWLGSSGLLLTGAFGGPTSGSSVPTPDRVAHCFIQSPGSTLPAEDFNYYVGTTWPRCASSATGGYTGWTSLYPGPDPDPFSPPFELWLPGSATSIYTRLQRYAVGNGDLAAPTQDVVQLHSAFCPARTALPELPQSSMFDALELACMARQQDAGGCEIDISHPIQVTNEEDLVRLQRQLECAADRFERIAQQVVFSNVPALVAQDIRSGSVSSTYPLFAGLYGAQVATLRGNMEQAVTGASEVAFVVRGFANDIALARSSLRSIDLEDQINEQQQQADMYNQIFGCLAAASPTVGVSFGVNGGTSVSENLGAVFVCANSIAQVIISDRIHQFRGEMLDESRLQTEIQASQAFSDRMHQLADGSHAFAEGVANVNATLSSMGEMRGEARREMERMLFLTRDDVGQELAYAAETRGRLSRTRAQYEEAHLNAIRMAYLARRAIEERVGMDLASLTTPMTLVDAPARWVDSVCSLNGVDFTTVWTDSSSTVPPRDAAPATPHGIQTVADYVARLRLFLDSYLLDYPFVNGTDVAVLSLNDDLLRPRVACSIDSYNVLRSSESVANETPAGLGAWRSDCPSGAACSVVEPAREGSVFREASTATTTGPAYRALGGGSAYRISTSCHEDVDLPGGPFGTGGGWGQDVALSEGTWRLSWYERRSSCADCGSDPRLHVAVTPPAGGIAVTLSSTTAVPTMSLGRWVDETRWQRMYADIAVPAEVSGSYFVGFYPSEDLDCATPDEVSAQVFGGVQLELLPAGVSLMDPRPYVPTDATGHTPSGLCSDPTGDGLRAMFVRRCDALCSTGFGDCPDGADSARCYYESQFAISLSQIERGELIPTGGFAVGNFNYRVDTLAVNLVGTGIRDCSTVADPSACYASGFVPFSLHHDGPFGVRNHLGDTVDIAIVPGRITFAKALTAERFLTNPLSGADRGLLTDYWRTEFQGRPLDGTYRIRIYDTPGLVWTRVQDIQVVLNYRYWTRQE